MKREIETLDATPSKRLFLSIMADYDLNKSLCELIDNALDVWVCNGKTQRVTVRVRLVVGTPKTGPAGSQFRAA